MNRSLTHAVVLGIAVAMSSYGAIDRHFPTTLTARLGPVNAEAVVVGDGGQYGDVSLGRYSTVIKPVSIPTSAPVSRQPFMYTVAAGGRPPARPDQLPPSAGPNPPVHTQPTPTPPQSN